jgi:hypothetical protein
LIEIRKKFLSCSNHKYSGSTADAVVWMDLQICYSIFA